MPPPHLRQEGLLIALDATSRLRHYRNRSVALPSPRRANLALAALFLGMFVMGSTEWLVVGVLDLIAADLRVSVPRAGWLVTGYALGLAVGGPVLTALTIRWDRRTVLAGALVGVHRGHRGGGGDR
jgi:predicted MFS family arabinose efflux permease